ncbi:glycosyltransferase [Dietzia sp. Alg238-R159]|uniref:glycosyltransferase n=1 Tax=Dietzia sp. Alg238-R159 TaxID=2305986 RepID=UPI0013D334B0|nr:glycosyltransferase [Dietzia sp. Alg238-R159]
MKTVLVVSLESVAPGTAASQHITGTEKRISAIAQERFVPRRVSSNKGAFLRRLATVTRGVVLERCDIAFIRFHPLLAFHVGWLKLKGVPTVISLQGIPDSIYAKSVRREKLKPLIDLLIKLEAYWANVVIVPHVGVGVTSHETHGITANFVVPNGFSAVGEGDSNGEGQGGQLDGAACQESDSKYVLFVGNFASWQGIPVMIEAAQDPRWPKGVRLIFVGDGALSEAVRQAAATNAHIEYVGKTGPSGVKEYMSRAAITLSIQDRVDATKNGVTPFKVMESISYGTPVIVSALPGQSEIISQTGAGLVIEPGDPKALALAVKSLMTDETQRLEEMTAAANQAKDWFAWERGSCVLYEAFAAAEKKAHRVGTFNRP